MPSDLDSNNNPLDRDLLGLSHSPINIYSFKNVRWIIPVELLQQFCLIGFRKRVLPAFHRFKDKCKKKNFKAALSHEPHFNIIQKEVKLGRITCPIQIRLQLIKGVAQQVCYQRKTVVGRLLQIYQHLLVIMSKIVLTKNYVPFPILHSINQKKYYCLNRGF